MARIDLPPGDGLEVTRALMLAPHFADVVAGYEKAVGRTKLDRRLHELVRYRVAQLNQCAVCLAFRQPSSGVSEELLAAVAEWAGSDRFRPEERAALAFTERFCCDSTSITDEQISELEALL